MRAQLMEWVKEDIEANLPELLVDQGLDIDPVYAVGYPTDQDKIFCCVRYADNDTNPDNKTFSFIIHWQLSGVSEIDAYKVLDANDLYMANFDPAGYEAIKWHTALTDNFRNRTIEAFYDITLTTQTDDCD